MVLTSPAWPVFFINFPQNPPLECKQLPDAVIVICFLQPAQRNLQKRRMWKK